MTSEFAALHAPGAMTVTASVWPTLLLPPPDRPNWLPSPLAYGLHLRGDQPLPEPGDEVHRGKILETVALEMAVTELTGQLQDFWEPEQTRPAIEPQKLVKHAALPAAATLDALVDDRVAVETKVVDGFDFDRAWGIRPPLYPRLQAQCQMACGGYELAYIAALVLRPKTIAIEVFEEQRRPDVVQLLEDRVGLFLEILRRGDLPAADETASSYEALQKTTILLDDPPLALAGAEAVERAAAWRQARLDRLAAEKAEDAAKYWFAARAGEAGVLELEDGNAIKRKSVRTKAHQVKESTYWKWTVA